MSSIQPRAPMTHDLKCWPEFFQAIVDRVKPFEVRKADRDYQVDDTLLLKEWTPHVVHGIVAGGRFTEREIAVTVTYILRDSDFDAVASGYCIMGIKRPENPAGLALGESDVLLDLAKGTVRPSEQTLVAILGNLAISRWVKTGLIQWKVTSFHNFSGAYVVTDAGRLAAVGATPAPQERRPERA